MDAQTHENVLAAVHGEAFAHARYLLFAAAARKRGSDRLASMFEGIAAWCCKSTSPSSPSSSGSSARTRTTSVPRSRTRTARVEATYPGFALQALAAGDVAVAERFAEMAEDEHENSLEATLEQLEVPA
jgi:rubrerythrin